MARPRNRNYKIVPGAEPAIDALKFEISKNLGLQDTIERYGWTRLTTIDAGNVGGAIQQVINELGQRKLIEYYQEGRIDEVTRLSPGTQPEKYDLTRTRLLNTDLDQTEEFQKAHGTKPGQFHMDGSNGAPSISSQFDQSTINAPSDLNKHYN